jgi:hypothetical protein
MSAAWRGTVAGQVTYGYEAASMLLGIHLELAGADGAPVVHDTQLGWNKDGQQTQVGGFALETLSAYFIK